MSIFSNIDQVDKPYTVNIESCILESIGKTLLINEINNNPDLENDLIIISDLMAGARLNKVPGRDTRAILKGVGVSNVVIDMAYNRMVSNYKQDIVNVDAK